MDDNIEVRIEAYRRQRNMALDALAETEVMMLSTQQELEKLRERNQELEKFKDALVDQLPTTD